MEIIPPNLFNVDSSPISMVPVEDYVESMSGGKEELSEQSDFTTRLPIATSNRPSIAHPPTEGVGHLGNWDSSALAPRPRKRRRDPSPSPTPPPEQPPVKKKRAARPPNHHAPIRRPQMNKPRARVKTTPARKQKMTSLKHNSSNKARVGRRVVKGQYY